MNKKNQKKGYFGKFGGVCLPDALADILADLSDNYEKLKEDEAFLAKLKKMYKTYANRPSNLYYSKRLSKQVGCKVYLKREDLNHTGAHKINNTIGQGLVAKSMNKEKLIAETGAGQHGVATATIASYLGLECDIYMGSRDIKAQKPNVYRMKVLGAKVVEVDKGQKTLKDAVDVALESYVKEADSAHYLLGSAVGPHPYPTMVRDFQKVIGEEIYDQIHQKENRMPTAIVACVGGGSNAMGAFYRFVEEEVELIAVEPAGKGKLSHKHGLALGTGKFNTIHGYNTLVLTNEKGEIKESYSAASGLDYPGVAPELSMMKENGRLTLGEATDEEAVDAFVQLSELEGIIPALESAHAIAYLLNNKDRFEKDDVIVVNLSGRGDKDVENVYEKFLS